MELSERQLSLVSLITNNKNATISTIKNGLGDISIPTINRELAYLVRESIIEKNGCPLSYRSVTPLDYKKAMILFYEQNNIAAYKKLFMEQYAFAVENYF